MTRVYVADTLTEERSALRLMLLNLNMEVVGEASDWATTLTQAPVSRTDMLLVDWDLLPRISPSKALDDLRKICPTALVIILISHLDARQQAALSAGADAFISRSFTSPACATSASTPGDEESIKRTFYNIDNWKRAVIQWKMKTCFLFSTIIGTLL